MSASTKLLLGSFVRFDSAELLEWLAYHRAIGASEFHIFTDRKSAGKRPLLDALAAGGAITLHPVAMDPNLADDDSNAALRLAALEGQESGGYGLYLARDEYLRINSKAKTIQSLMSSSHGADVLSLPVTVLGFGDVAVDLQGFVMQGKRPRARLPFNDPGTCDLRSVARLGMFATRTPEVPTGPAVATGSLKWVNGDGAPMPSPHSRILWRDMPEVLGTRKAEILKLPGASVESFLARALALPPAQRPRPDALLADIDALGAKGEPDPCLSAWATGTLREMDALMALPGVAEAMQALCAAEDAVRATLPTEMPEMAQYLPARSAPHSDAPATTPERPLSPEDDTDDFGADHAHDKAAKAPALPLWLAEIHMSGDQQGFYARLANHAVACIRRDDARLIVTFDNLSNVNDLSLEREPWAYKFVRDNGYSHLSVMARRKDWYRDPQLIDYLEKLAGDGFFNQFGQVFFAGTSMGGFAALAFASLAPGATVISFNPQTTLDSTLVPWEERFVFGQKRDWSLPYSDCAYEIDDVEKAFVFYDPFFTPDRRHVDRLEGANVTRLKTWCSGHFSPVFLRRADLLKPVMSHAINGTLTPAVFYAMFRDRRHLPWYRKALISNLEERGHVELAKRVTPAFRKLRREAAE